MSKASYSLRTYAEFSSAVKVGNQNTVEALLQQHPDLISAKSEGQTPLYHAAYHGHAEVVTVLLDHGVNPNGLVDEAIPPIWIAARNGHADVIKRLAEAGADVDVVAYQSGIGLPEWIVAGQDEIAEPLGVPPLLIAVHSQHAVAVAALLKRGANPNFVTYHNQWSILLVAIKYRNIEIVKLLLNFGVNVHSGHEYEQNNMKYSVSPLWVLIRQVGETDEDAWLEIVDLLLEFGADPMYGKLNKTTNLLTPTILTAIRCQCFKIARKVLLAGAGIGYRFAENRFSTNFNFHDCILIDVGGIQHVDGAITTIQEYYRYLCDKERSGWLSIHALFSHLVKLSLLILQKELSDEQRETYYDGLCQRFISKLKSIDADTLSSFIRYFSAVMHVPPGARQEPLSTIPLYNMKYYKPVMKQYAAWLINALQARTLKWSAALFLISSKRSPIPEEARGNLKRLIGAGKGRCPEGAIDMVAGMEPALKEIRDYTQPEPEPELESNPRRSSSCGCVIS